MIKCFKFLICFALIFNFSNKADAITGVGLIKFSYNSMNNFFAYLKGDGNPSSEVGVRKGAPLAFAINPEGTVSHYYYCPLKFGSGACKSADTQAVQGCSKRSKARGYGRCKLFARGYKVVWGGANIKFSRKFDEQVVRTIFEQKEWYGNSATEKKPKIAKKKETKPKVSKKYSAKGERAIALSWEGYSDLIIGRLTFDEKNYKGKIIFDLTDSQSSCEGTYSLLKNGSGTWQISCSNQKAASGKLKWIKDGEVTGEGKDINNKIVKFTVEKKT